MIITIGIIYLISLLCGSLYFWYLHSRGELVSDYPYDDKM